MEVVEGSSYVQADGGDVGFTEWSTVYGASELLGLSSSALSQESALPLLKLQ